MRKDAGGDHPLLSVSDLHVDFATSQGVVQAVRGVSFDVGRGETLGIVGESGSGKSVTARAIMRLLPATARIPSGRILFAGSDVNTMSASEIRNVRGAKIAMVYQDPTRALNPTMKIGAQLVEALRAHTRGLSIGAARDRVLGLLDAVQIPAAAERFESYPHQLSGGMRQRVVIAMALSMDPQLLIADEPTTALDVTVQAQILDLLAELQADRGMAMILVTHDLAVAACHTGRIAVMYAGQMVEQATTSRLFESMRMPYTRALFDSIPRLEDPPHQPLTAISGRPPDPFELPGGCSFHPRCAHASDLCRREPPSPERDGDGHSWSCHHPLDRTDVAPRGTS